MTDSDLDRAVALECFGNRSPIISRADNVLRCLDNPMCRPDDGEYRAWSPTSDALDAEKVWDWHKAQNESWKRELCLAAVETARSSKQEKSLVQEEA